MGPNGVYTNEKISIIKTAESDDTKVNDVIKRIKIRVHKEIDASHKRNVKRK